MLKAKTSALIAAISVLGTVAPAAFAQDVNVASIEGVDQSNTNTFDISQSLAQLGIASAEPSPRPDNSDGDATSAIPPEVQEILDALGL